MLRADAAGLSYVVLDRVPNMTPPQTLAELVQRCDDILTHAWMVRTFVKHSEEVDDYPELMEVVRVVFDATRALETRVSDPAAYVHMLRKKYGKLKAATEQFAVDAPRVSMHTNFAMAVRSLQICVRELGELLQLSQQFTVRAGPVTGTEPS